MARDFDMWVQSFQQSISSYDYYVNFEQVHNNINNIKNELLILNQLIGSNNIEKDFINIIEKYPKVLKCIPILLAERKNELIVMDNNESITYNFKTKQLSNKDYIKFMTKTQLFNLLANKKITNLIDYVIGVEVGLNSNGRKNRTGTIMSTIIENALIKAVFTKNINYFKEVSTSNAGNNKNYKIIDNNYNISKKRFDFVVKTNSKTYLIEVNFYNNAGSKLNEVARSYKSLAQEINAHQDKTFVWFTDGTGWHKAKTNLREAFNVIPHIYNINDIKNGIIKTIFI